MTIYYVGYDNKPYKEDFVIMAETRSKGVALMIQKSYNEAYERNGMSLRLEIRTADRLGNYRYATA